MGPAIKDSYVPMAINALSMPTWMIVSIHSKDGTFIKVQTIPIPELPQLPTKTIKLVRDAKKRTIHQESLLAHCEDSIEAQNLELPANRLPLFKEPRGFECGRQWRDPVRQQLSFSKLRVAFFIMRHVVGPVRESMYSHSAAN